MKFRREGAEKSKDGWALYQTNVVLNDGSFPRLSPYFDTIEELAEHCTMGEIRGCPCWDSLYERILAFLKTP